MAKRIGFPEAVRAVAGVNGANTMDVFAPCHRVIHTMGTVISL
ncbi:MAG: MGMT family protein [Porphyromonas sp.]|nr:MGMT family protein [Porphyromonas sp.]